MNCNVCGRKMKSICTNCEEDLDEQEFYCYNDGEFLNGHFCQSRCWEEWIIIQTRGTLEIAEADE